jgi:transcriptional regulator with XRE-family HTH domain
MSLHIMLRRRREALLLTQAAIAELLEVTPECVCCWESGRRRMELNKIPRIADALHLDPRELCLKALAEFHPRFNAALFGTDRAPAAIAQRPAA